MAKKVEKTAVIKIELTKSLIGRKENQILTAKSLGLTKIGKVVEQPDNAATRGKIATISHMVKVIE